MLNWLCNPITTTQNLSIQALTYLDSSFSQSNVQIGYLCVFLQVILLLDPECHVLVVAPVTLPNGN